ncbi:MAG: phosphopyruvate hydratase [Elusimicrobia bacterium GWA2_69_24]|nr:MAG: phosphopyruvate hydratase [Elusimicrobia bacterium GWA2_69_24]
MAKAKASGCTISEVHAREILDSRGFPTLEAEVVLADGSFGRAAVPSGASTGEHEAVELRDGDKARYAGKGVLKAVANAEKVLGPAVKGMDASEQHKLDERMIALDGTPNKGKLGANALLGVSMAASRAAAASRKVPLYRHLRDAFGIKDPQFLLPVPMLNIINGGKHADSGIDVQEFMVVPVGAPSFPEALRMGAEVYQILKKILKSRNHAVAVGDEGGFAPRIKTHEEVLQTIVEAIDQAGYAGQVKLGLDSAASEFFDGKAYGLEGQPHDAAALTRRYAAWVDKFPIVSLEDPLAENDWAGYQALTASLGSRVRVIGDDLYVTNPERLERGIRECSTNAILIKLNQIGTVTETVQAVLKAHEAGFSCVVSHRSGETEDAYISDFTVAFNTGAIKTGAPCRSERLAKYNQLLRIHSELGPRAEYAGDKAFRAASPAVGA